MTLEDPMTCLVDLLDYDGRAAGGLYLPFDDRLPRVTGRVTAVRPNPSGIEEGDVVLFPAHSAAAIAAEGETLYALRLEKIVAVIEGYDSPEEIIHGVA